MKIVTYNIQFGLGKDGHNDLGRIADEIRGADIIALQEVERNWQHSGLVDQPKLLGDILAQYYWVYGPYFDVDASQKSADGKIINARRQFGNMILSKTPILCSRLFPLPKSFIVDQRNMAMGMLEGVVDLGNGRALRIYNAHLSAKSESDRIEQIHCIRKTIAQAPGEGGAWTGSSDHPLWLEDKIAPPMPDEFMLLGDFNLPANGPEYSHLIRRDEKQSDLIDSWTHTGHASNEGVTFRDSEPGGGQRIDFAFVDQSMQSQVTKSWIDEDALGSDHQPFWIETDESVPL
ncbi:MAG: hydrolase [Alphaproteobacteria bacterium]|nr:hydrolase [Alphaproteobacteria bacterium]